MRRQLSDDYNNPAFNDGDGASAEKPSVFDLSSQTLKIFGIVAMVNLYGRGGEDGGEGREQGKGERERERA